VKEKREKIDPDPVVTKTDKTGEAPWSSGER